MSEAKSANPQRRWRATLWSILAILALSVVLPSIGYVMAQSGGGTAFGDRDANPRAEMWRDAREGEGGFTTQTGPYVTNTMISNVGENWRQFRTGPLMEYGGYFLAAVVILIALFFLIFGRSKLEHGRSGMTIPRWKGYERVLHWFVAISFIVLAITGLSLLFGREVLIPLFGAAGFAGFAQLSMTVHNYLGPAFSVGVLLMILLWARHNIPNRTDIEWFKAGGGMVGKKHPSAGKLNGGEKVWFWGGVFLLGILVSASGVILDFPIWGQTREDMALAQGVHAIAAILWIGFFLGHAYIGTLGTEGALEGMTRGRVDVNWAKQHHDLWYEDEIARGVKPEAEQSSSSGGAGAGVGQPSH
ncbi:formate dehydrogenase subunit gamma [Pseudazoarcus pumilus]|uniref:Formate dehydrogenase subunit gamma n=1 Tax=Pseudazoarcus pumilus TaxID=2067960 RepID=A0A2I6SAE7_9RHOO|nr:formate dehydrogenase subunit gamma [Pseudazoarcus pumilus]AUN96214.1 formate dehydrogenase subunit gamma [Pseudazoarcus pumilus]